MGSPNLTITVEPWSGGKALYLPLAASARGRKEQLKLALRLDIKNNHGHSVHVKGVTFSFPGSSAPEQKMKGVSVDIAAHDSESWSNGHLELDGEKVSNVVYLDEPAPPKVKVSVSCKDFDSPATASFDLAPFDNPNGEHGFLLPFSVEDLRDSEYIYTSSDHWYNGGAPGNQIFAHDITCVGPVSGEWHSILSDDSDKNSDYRIWNKPVRAMADGEVMAWLETIDENTVIGSSTYPDGQEKGNHIWVKHGDYQIAYCHLKKGSIPNDLKVEGRAVKAGQKLGVAGNSGNSSGPHTHIECWVETTNALRGIPFRDLCILDPASLPTSSVKGPWVQVRGKGLPKGTVLIWPMRRTPEWRGWQDLGKLESAPAAASRAAHRLDVFAKMHGQLCRKHYDGAEWHDWQKLGGDFQGSPAVVARGDRMNVFVRRNDDRLGHLEWNGNEWLDWKSFGDGEIASSPAAASWANDRIDVFAKGKKSGELVQKRWNGSSWGDWKKIGGFFQGAPAAVSWGSNRIDVFVRGEDDHLGHLLWNGDDWVGWEDLGGGVKSSPAVSSWEPHRLDVFVEGGDGHLKRKRFNGEKWIDWEWLGGKFKDRPAAVSWGPERVDVFVHGEDDHLGHLWRP